MPTEGSMPESREREIKKKIKDFKLNPEEFQEWLETALITLKDFGIENLTIIEERQLRADIKTAMKNNAELVAKGISSHDASIMLWPFAHAFENLLLHYGVNLHDLPLDPKTQSFRDDPALMEYLRNKIRKAREEAHKPYLD